MPWRRNRLPSPVLLGFPCDSAGKESTCNAGDLGWIPGLERFPWRRERLPTPVFWPGEFRGLCRLWGRRELDMTERLSLSLFILDVQCCAKLLYSKVSQLYTYMHSFFKKIFFPIIVYHIILNISFQK